MMPAWSSLRMSLSPCGCSSEFFIDIEGAIQALEGMQMKNSLEHPQGDKLIRKEDHAGIIDCYISRVEQGKYEVKRRIPKEDIAKNMPFAPQSLDDARVRQPRRQHRGYSFLWHKAVVRCAASTIGI